MPECRSQGGGIYIELGSLFVSESKFSHNFAHYGGAIMGNGGTAIVAACVFLFNTADRRGGAIFVGLSTAIEVDESAFRGNSAAVRILASFELLCSVHKDVALCCICSNTYHPGVYTCTKIEYYTHWSQINGGALFITNSASMSLTRCNMSSNQAPEASAIFHSSGTLILHQCSFSGHVGSMIELAAFTRWVCFPGQWGASSGIIEAANFTGCPNFCQVGTFGKYTNLTKADECIACPSGHYCPFVGMETALPCPEGSSVPSTGSTDVLNCNLCALGQFNDRKGQPSCQPCPAGTYSDALGATACDKCPAGGFCPEVDGGANSRLVFQPCNAGSWSSARGSSSNDTCNLCPPGTSSHVFGAPNSFVCTPCRAGTAAPVPGLPICEVCAAGRFQGEVGATSCITCPAGSYCPLGSGHPLLCERGTYSNESGLDGKTKCKLCPPHHSCSSGVRIARPCDPGSDAPHPGSWECTLCPIGSYKPSQTLRHANLSSSIHTPQYPPSMPPPDASAPPPLFPLFPENASAVAPRTLCQVCLAGHKCHRGSLSPQICSPGSFALAGHPETECTPCAAGYFQDAPGASQCKPCAQGLFCPTGSANPIGCESGAGIPYAQTTVALARSSSSCVCKAGYYDSGSTSEGGALACQSCPAGTSCNNPGTTLVKLPLQAGYFRLHNQSIDVRKCPDSGANCSNVPVCAMSTSGCVGSANENGSEAASSVCNEGLDGVFCLLCSLSNGSRVYYSPASNSARAQCKECGNLVLEHILIAGGIIMLVVLLVPCAQHIHRIRMAKSSIDFRILVKLKILIGFSLIISVIDDVYEVDLPPDAKWLLTFYQAVVSIGFDVNIDVVLQCLSMNGYVSKLVVYMVTPAAIAVCLILLGAIRMHRDRRLQAVAECSAPHLLTLFFIASPLVTRVAFSAFSCYEFEESAWLKVDVAIQCHTDEHHVAQLLALLAIVIYPVGLLLVNGTLLLYARRVLIQSQPTPLSRAISFLYNDYKPHMIFWELLEMLRRFTLMGLLVLYQDTMMQLAVAAFLCAVFLLLQLIASPYQIAVDSFLASLASFSLLVVFQTCVLFKYASLTNVPDIREKMSQEQENLYILDVDTLLFIFFAGSVSVFCLAFCIVVSQLSAEATRLRVHLLSKLELDVLTSIVKNEAIQAQQDSAARLARPRGKVIRLRKSKVSILTTSFSSIEISTSRKSKNEMHPSTLTSTNSACRFTVNTLITGKPHDAAADLVCHLGVPDPFGLVVNGVQKIAAEVARFVDTMSRLPDDSLESVTLLSMAHPNSIGINLLRQSALEVEEWFQYVMHQSTSEKTFYNGVRDKGRGTVGLDFFVKHEVARQAQLDAAHVVALRFYTTHIFKFINGPLRSTMYGNGKLPHPLPVTVMFISEGIKKLRSVYALSANATKVVSLWRGMRNLTLAEEFMEELRGGTEVAPMSATTNIGVALKYCFSDDSLLLKFKVSNFLQYGAELQWLSAFPDEAEVCYPPLTYIQPTGNTQIVRMSGKRFSVYEVVPHIP